MKSLDEQYLQYCNKTASIFNEFPEIEPLRYFIFRDILVNKRKKGILAIVRYYIRSALKRPKTKGKFTQSDIIIWWEANSSSTISTMKPVILEMKKRKLNFQILGLRVDNDLLPFIRNIEYSTPLIIPKWIKTTWNNLVNAYAELNDIKLYYNYFIACMFLTGRYNELDRIFNLTKPKLIIDASTGLVGGASLIITGKKKGIKSIVIQHGIAQIFHTPVISDFLFTWGEVSRKYFLKNNINHEKIVTIGSPKHDPIYSRTNEKSKCKLLEYFSLSDKKIFVFFSNGNDLQRNGHAPIETAKWLSLIASEFKQLLHIIVRLHPKEDGSLYREYVNLHILRDELNLETTLDGCDLVGSICSTVLYEALLFNKPIWQFAKDSWPHLADNYNLGLCDRIHSLDQFRKTIKSFCHHKYHFNNNSEIISVFANHGFATKKALDFIEQNID